MDETERNLVERARDGDDSALEALLQQYQGPIYRFGMKMCGDPEDAKEVLQETLLAMARSMGSYRGESSLSTWLYSIARSYCTKKRRRSRFAPDREQSLDTELAGESSAVEDPGRTPEETTEGREVAAVLESALDALEPDAREVLVLRDIEGLTAPEVAEVVGIGVGAVKSRLHRARLRLRELVAPALGVVEVSAAPGSGCPDILQTYSEHLEGDIAPELCAEMERHLTECPRCAGACDSLKRTLSLCQATPSGAVPPAVQRSVRVALRDFLAGSGEPAPV